MRFNALLAVIIILLISACTTDQADRLVSGKIESTWSSGTIKYAEISFNDKHLAPNHISYTISEKIFGSLNPVPGNCVKVWFKQFNGSSIPYGDMNLVSCY